MMLSPNNAPRLCVQCSLEIVGGSPKRIYCSRSCWNEQRRQKRGAGGSIIVGSILNCKECGAPFTKEHKRQFYCSPCNALSARDYLPSQRARVIAYQAARNKRRRAEIPSVTINERISAGVKNSLRDGKGGHSWEVLLSYTLPDLMVHLERQFLPGMTWGNRGDWHIDHIVPLASFKFETPDCPEFRAAWALSNLRPLWAVDNIRKSDKRTHLL